MPRTSRPEAPGRIVSARSDLLFRWIFGDQDNTRLLASLLRGVLPDLPSSEWDYVRPVDPRLPGRGPQRKETVLDVRALTATGSSVNVEIQLLTHPAMRERMAYYAAELLVDQLDPGASYRRLRPAITVAITGFELTRGAGYHSRNLLYDPDHHEVFTNIVQVHTLELPKVPATDDGTPAWRWMRFFAADTEEDLDMAAADDPEIARAVSLVRRYNHDDTAYRDLLSREKFLWDQWAREHYAREEGMEQGREEGMEQGREEARQENARNALRMGLSVAQVAQITGLDPSDVEALGPAD